MKKAEKVRLCAQLYACLDKAGGLYSELVGDKDTGEFDGVYDMIYSWVFEQCEALDFEAYSKNKTKFSVELKEVVNG